MAGPQQRTKLQGRCEAHGNVVVTYDLRGRLFAPAIPSHPHGEEGQASLRLPSRPGSYIAPALRVSASGQDGFLDSNPPPGLGIDASDLDCRHPQTPISLPYGLRYLRGAKELWCAAQRIFARDVMFPLRYCHCPPAHADFADITISNAGLPSDRLERRYLRRTRPSAQYSPGSGATGQRVGWLTDPTNRHSPILATNAPLPRGCASQWIEKGGSILDDRYLGAKDSNIQASRRRLYTYDYLPEPSHNSSPSSMLASLDPWTPGTSKGSDAVRGGRTGGTPSVERVIQGTSSPVQRVGCVRRSEAEATRSAVMQPTSTITSKIPIGRSWVGKSYFPAVPPSLFAIG
ncbi:hypothetical protein FA13DRAFT_1880265 [Coprinellus micaceus]|uniref:Uncharacterized protein n=1 Tax=Coprinellus micaceus TaxID=71717 RepID=A0A4Y7TU43_COPMI|nr:hypothetical protein FA13DRAFT_1880265 [Coprinellus micaceus]